MFDSTLKSCLISGTALAALSIAIASPACAQGTQPGDTLPGTRFFDVDLSDEPATRALTGRVAKALGRVDILVHCAALVGTSELKGWAVPLPEQTTDAWDKALRVNLTAAFALSQSARPLLEKSPAASIIFVSSIYGVGAVSEVRLCGAKSGMGHRHSDGIIDGVCCGWAQIHPQRRQQICK